MDLQLVGGAIRFWARQPGTLHLGCPENTYRPDFLVIDENGWPRYEDVKGQETAKFKRDKKLWAAYGPCSLWILKSKGKKWQIEKISLDNKPLTSTAARTILNTDYA